MRIKIIGNLKSMSCVLKVSNPGSIHVTTRRLWLGVKEAIGVHTVCSFPQYPHTMDFLGQGGNLCFRSLCQSLQDIN